LASEQLKKPIAVTHERARFREGCESGLWFKKLLRFPYLLVRLLSRFTDLSHQVCHLLKEAKNPGKIISDTPDLMEPAMVASALVTFKRKWPEKDPVQVSTKGGSCC